VTRSDNKVSGYRQPFCPTCREEWEYSDRPAGATDELTDIYGCANGHQWPKFSAIKTEGQRSA
jgi:hypothetical protein